MSSLRYARRRDLNEPEIVQALEACACDVLRASDVDLIVGRAGRTFLLEVKRPKRAVESRISPIQKRLRSGWRGHYAIVQSVEQALAAVGLHTPIATAEC